MAFFQKSVVNKFLKSQEQQSVEEAFEKFKAYFHNVEIQKNIREAKEEQFQEGFLRELFVNVLGYTLNPQPRFNLTTEYKNEKGAKKADGAILQNGKALAVIELKGTDTKDLDKINNQAFSYKNNHSACVYVITSNFEKLRFFIHNSVDHLEFNLFTLTQSEFELLWLCLTANNLLGGLPLKVKEESVLAEENITKQLYKDYSTFKVDLWQNMVKNSPESDQLLLFKKTQKLLDRFLFIFFAEDSGLLPPNSITRMIKRWEVLKDEDAYKPLYDIFKQYFEYVNIGRKGKSAQDDIFAYNGGLFITDEVLNNMIIDDDLLHRHVMKLTAYDFQSEVDVNILGHIFENSLSEIENIIAKLEGQEVDKSKTKRKKDGVFYTPKYITKYIVDNTIGKLCVEKKAELSIIDEEYAKGRSRRKKDTIKKLDKNLQAYRKWLLGITICDPACGSGAFLNQALDFLIVEHSYIDELESMLLGYSFEFPGVEAHILEKNIYGVDINEESVEIAKLSLWLRTAQRGRKLTSLNDNLKCGNSLIDDPEVAGDKAFNWQNEFPEVFKEKALPDETLVKSGGFDVVIGNPPYVTRGISESLKQALKSNYQTAQYQLELYVAFIERGVDLIKKTGFISYIVPNSWLKNMMMSECRKFLLNNLDIQSMAPNLESVFPDASVDTMIFIGTKQKIENKTKILEFRNQELFFRHIVNQTRFSQNEGFIFDVEVSEEVLPIVQKMKTDISTVAELLDVIRGINPYDRYTGQSPEVIKTRAYHANYQKDETFVPELKGLHTSRYLYSWDNKHYISYGDWLAAPRNIKYFEGDRIVFREILGKTLVSTLIKENFKIDRSLYIAKLEEDKKESFDIHYILGILNSKLMAFYFRYTNNEFDNLFPKIRVAEFKRLPIKNISFTLQSNMSQYVSLILSKSKCFQDISISFQKYLLSQFSIEKLSKKNQNWYELEFGEFIRELNKSILKAGVNKLSKTDEMEWMEVFETKKAEIQKLKADIDKTDNEIDLMVFHLYGLTYEEVKIVDENFRLTKEQYESNRFANTLK